MMAHQHQIRATQFDNHSAGMVLDTQEMNVPGKCIPDIRSFSGSSMMLFGEVSCSAMFFTATSAKKKAL
jgi:hypothetical protein